MCGMDRAGNREQTLYAAPWSERIASQGTVPRRGQKIGVQQERTGSSVPAL